MGLQPPLIILFIRATEYCILCPPFNITYTIYNINNAHYTATIIDQQLTRIVKKSLGGGDISTHNNIYNAYDVAGCCAE